MILENIKNELIFDIKACIDIHEVDLLINDSISKLIHKNLHSWNILLFISMLEKELYNEIKQKPKPNEERNIEVAIKALNKYFKKIKGKVVLSQN